MYDEEYDNDFGMSDDELLYREMNPEDPWYMGPSEDNIIYDTDEIDVDDLPDWDKGVAAPPSRFRKSSLRS